MARRAETPSTGAGSSGPLTVPYLGPGWGRLALERLRTDPRVGEAVQGLSVRVLTKVRDAPPGRYAWLYAAFEGGSLAEGRMGHDGDGQLDALPAPTFTIEGPYEAFAAVQRGEVTERRALLSGRLKLHGSRLTALRLMARLEAVTDVLGEIPCAT